MKKNQTEEEKKSTLMVFIDFEEGEMVYLRTDPDQKKRMVTGYWKRSNDLLYELTCGTTNSFHRDIEISRDKDYVMTTDN